MRKITTADILKRLSEGWELGHFREGCTGRFAIQNGGICKGGDSERCNASSVESLIKRGIIVAIPRRINDPYWLTRYELKN